ncbi:MAG: hypothetical protein LBO08_01065 [Rickettsiales bacterium]|jgi:hypothetical protein|nr:hypothetical protein [Rickettsiales bacterium]
MTKLNRFFRKILFILPITYALCSINSYAATTNTPGGSVGDFGTYLGADNIAKYKSQMTDDLAKFQNQMNQNQTQITLGTYVPPEARLAKSFMTAMSSLAKVLDRSLVPFMTAFIFALFAFWLVLESYNIVQNGGEVKKFWHSVVWKVVIIGVWVWFINNTYFFMEIFGPVIDFGGYITKFFLDSIITESGTAIPDNCPAITQYMSNFNGAISPQRAANLVCAPTRMSGILWTAVHAGFTWIKTWNPLQMVVGIAFVWVFLKAVWKFALMALNVIVDLFLCLILLPFTALTECFAGGTQLKGIAGDIFTKFATMFNAASFENQIARFINAVVFFISLSVVIGICGAILSNTISPDLASKTPTLQDTSFMVILISGALVAYLASKAEEIAGNLGGKIEGKLAENVIGEAKQFGKGALGIGKQVWKNWGK